MHALSIGKIILLDQSIRHSNLQREKGAGRVAHRVLNELQLRGGRRDVGRRV